MPVAGFTASVVLAVRQLVVGAYTDEHRAAEVLATLQRLRTGAVVRAEDAVCVVRATNWHVSVQHRADLGEPEGATSHFWRTLISSLVLTPGAASERARTQDYGIASGFERALAAALPPGSSAVFIIVPRPALVGIARELRRFGGTVLSSPLGEPAGGVSEDCGPEHQPR
jgi:uncharacterized membrane protein